MQSFEIFSELLDATTEEEWCALLFSLGQGMGFEQVLYALVPPGKRLEDAFLRSSYSDEWRSTYDTTGLHHVDPTVGHCVQKSTPLIWSPEIFVSKAQKEMYEEACGYGIRSGITIPVHGPGGELGIMCFVNDAKPGKRFRNDLYSHLPDLSLLRDMAFESSRKFVSPTPAGENPPVLTSREKECLRWTMQGKTSWEISQILKCSEATVNFHIKNIRRKFDVTSKQAAIVKALKFGLIQP